MTIATTVSKAGPFFGDGVQTEFPFEVTTYVASDIVASIAGADDIETVLAYGVDYSVSLNADQKASPGGTVTYPISGSPLPSGSKIVLRRVIPNTQDLDIENAGAFLPEVVEQALDRIVMQIQQIGEVVERVVVAPVTEDFTPTTFFDDLKALVDAGSATTIVEGSTIPDLIVNGDMQVAQRQTGLSTTDTSTTGRVYGADRFYAMTSNAAQQVKATRTVLTPNNAPVFSGVLTPNFLRIERGASWSPSGSDFVRLAQSVPSERFMIHANGQISIRFAVRSKTAGNYACIMTLPGSSGSFRYYAAVGYTINAADTWEEKVVTFAKPGSSVLQYLMLTPNCATFMWTIRGAGVGIAADNTWSSTAAAPESLGIAGQADALVAGGYFDLTAVHSEAARLLSYDETVAECRRFYSRSANWGVHPSDASGAVYQGGYNSSGGGNVRLGISFGSAMHMRGTSTPTVVTYKPGTTTAGQLNRLADSTAITGLTSASALSNAGHSWEAAMTGQTNHGVSFCWEASADPTF